MPADKSEEFNIPLVSLFDEGIQFLTKNDFLKAFLHFEKAANLGHLDAQFCLGTSYLNGNGVQQSDQKAFHWFELAAKQGDPTAQRILGTMYEYEKGVDQNYEYALYCYRLVTNTVPDLSNKIKRLEDLTRSPVEN